MSGEICFTADMKTNESSSSGNQLWGIYFTDREYAREMGDPLRTVIEAPTKLAAEEDAARLGFSEPATATSQPNEPVSLPELTANPVGGDTPQKPSRDPRIAQVRIIKPQST